MIFIAAICCMASCKEAAPQYANRAEMIAAQIHNPNSKSQPSRQAFSP